MVYCRSTTSIEFTGAEFSGRTALQVKWRGRRGIDPPLPRSSWAAQLFSTPTWYLVSGRRTAAGTVLQHGQIRGDH